MLVCKFCFTVQPSLSVHLRRRCMKNSTADEIKDVVDEAKRTFSRLASKASVWDYSTLKEIVSEDSQVASLIREMKDQGICVTNVPSATGSQDAGPSAPSAQPYVPIHVFCCCCRELYLVCVCVAYIFIWCMLNVFVF